MAKTLAHIRTQYLQARPPQQIIELTNVLEKITTTQKDATSTTTLSKDQEAVELSSIRKKCTIVDDPSKASGSGMEEGKQEDLDELGSETKRDEEPCRNVVTITNSSGECASSSIIVPNSEIEAAAEVLRGLFILTIGHPPHLATGKREQYQEEQDASFLHPPIQYRIAFAKYIIKQLELSGNWSAPQGSNEEDEGDPIEQEVALLLEEWYDGLESLSNSSAARQVFSEPFYRLYEIKVAHHNRKGSDGTSPSSSKECSATTTTNWKHKMMKIFESTSYVKDGTTGLVTWKASTEFLKWLTSSREDGGKLLLEKLGEGKEIGWVLELGCGCGFLAVALCKCIAGTLNQYIATDGSLAALEKAKLNVETNFSDRDAREKLTRERIRFEKVEWQNEETRESFSQLVDGMTCIYGADKGLLLGADIIFDAELIPDLVALISTFLEAKAGRAILACTIRNEATMELFRNELDSKHLSTEVCGSWEDGEIFYIGL